MAGDVIPVTAVGGDLGKLGDDFSRVVTLGGIPESILSTATGAFGSTTSNRQEIKGSDVSIRQTDSPTQIVYGWQRVGGIFTFVQTDVPAGGKYLHLVLTVAGHKINQVLKLILDDVEVTFGGGGIHPGDPRWGSGLYENLVFMSTYSLGDENQPANADLVAQSNRFFAGKWTENQKQRGNAHIYLILQYDKDVFSQGLPQIQFEIEGKADIYDPRTGNFGYTSNAALCLADIILDPIRGLGAPMSEIDMPNLANAAAICDDIIHQANGNFERRYTVNAVFDSSEAISSIIEKMRGAMGGDVTYVGGKWRFYPAAWRVPMVTLTTDDIRSPLRVNTNVARRDSFNAIKGTYLSYTDWKITDFPPVRNALYRTEDGEENYQDVTYPCTVSSSCCQRLAKIELERGRQGITIEGDWGLSAFSLQPCDTVNIQLDDFGWFGWAPKIFEVREVHFNIQQGGGADGGDAPTLVTTLLLRETASGIYDWDYSTDETKVDVAPNTDLPKPSDVQPPTNLQLYSGTGALYIRADGTVFSRIKATWTAANDPFVSTAGRYEVQYKRSTDAVWLSSASVLGDSELTYILDVQDGWRYDVRIRSATALNFTSPWVQVLGHVVLGKTQNPSDVLSFTALIEGFTIGLSWLPVSDLDLDGYEIRYGDDWSTGVIVTRTDSTTYRWAPQVIDEYRLMNRAYDTSGNYSTIAAVAIAVINRPPAPTNTTVQFIGPNVLFQWQQAPGGFAIADYEIRQGPVFETATAIGYSKTTAFSMAATWGGTSRLWITPRDIAGNLGYAAAVDATIIPPGPVQSLVAEVVDNFVLLRWVPPLTGTLPINRYDVRRGASYATAEIVYEARGTFAPIFERTNGIYTYWITPVDTAYNDGQELAVSSTISQPPDYVFYADVAVDLASGTYVNAFVEAGCMILPVDVAQTWDSHYTSHGWTTAQAQIDAGLPVYIQPALPGVDGYGIFVVDLGAVIDSCIINLDYVTMAIAGNVAVSSTISTSLDGSSYVPQPGPIIVGSNFRYVKVQLIGRADTMDDIVKLTQIRVRASVRQENDGGFATGNAADASGTTVLFNKPFLDITSLTVSALQQDPLNRVNAEYAFVDTPNPTQFQIFIYRTNTGQRVSGTVSWAARGIVA